jgi:hypothetical protein
MSSWDAPEAALLSILPQLGRGPKRGGVFALWLTVRVARGLLLEPPLPERSHRRRVQALERRLSSLTMPTPLRRALAAAVSQLRDGQPEAAAQALTQMVAPARDTSGPEAGDAIALAARLARQSLR